MLNRIKLNAPEIYLIFTSVIFLILGTLLSVNTNFILLDIACIIYSFVLAYLFRKIGERNVLRYILIVPPAYVLYAGVKPIIDKLHSSDMDNYLIKIDRFIFGTDPTKYLAEFTDPILTEYLQICYFLFFLLPLLHGIEYLINNKTQPFLYLARNIIFAFLFSYLLYFFIPAIGPRFTLHNFELLSQEIPGLFFTEYIRDFINYGGGITNPNVDASLQVNRDCMPSGHTMMTLINIILAFRFGSKFKYIFLIIGASLVFSTVYLRYHYVIDVFAGVIFALISIKLEKNINKLISK